MDELRPPARGVDKRHVTTRHAENLKPVKDYVDDAVDGHSDNQAKCVEERQMPLGALLHYRVQDRRIRRHRVMPQGKRVNSPHEREDEEPHRGLGRKKPENKHRKIYLRHPPRHQEAEEQREH